MPELDLGTYLEDDTLVLKGVPSTKHPAGKAYRVPSPSAKFGLQLQRLMAAWSQQAKDAVPTEDEIKDLVGVVTDDDGNPVDFNAKLFGPALQEMLDDGVSATRLEMIRTVVMANHTSGHHVAQMLVDVGEAKARADRAPKRTRKKTAGGKSRRASGDTANPTPTPDSLDSSTPPNGSEAQAV